MQNFIQNGDYLTLPAAPYALAPGDGAFVGGIFGVSANASENGEECVLAVAGVFRLLKVMFDTFAIGDPCFWDVTDKAITSDADGGDNPLVGVAVAAADGASITADVRLNGAVATVTINEAPPEEP
jgi:predicted RecA/RadA family phage recombinase